jgi:RNA polymerase subunit RPABC4/transcription elongation factor Spt4
MGLFDEESLERLVASGCPACGSVKLTFRTYVDGLLPIMGAEPIGRIKWVYDGEKFVDGVFQITCAACKAVAFASDVCPRCHAPHGLNRALETPNAWPVPASCPTCESEELRYIAFLPALVTYEGKRADKARSATELPDDGFHGHRVDCRICGTVAERTDRCPLCEAAGPLRPRPE